MKKIFLFLCLAVSLDISAQQQLFVNLPKDSVVRIDSRTQQFEFVQGEILIRYKDDVSISTLKSAGIAQTGIASIDQVFRKFKVSQTERLFPDETKLKSKVMLRGFNGQEFEQPSLHNIYKLKIQEDQKIFEAIQELKQDSNVIYAEPNYILSITDDKPVSPVLTEEDLKNGAWMADKNDAGYKMQDAGYRLQDASSDPATQQPSYLGTQPSRILHPASPNPAPSFTPNDPLYSQQWYIPAVHANEVWDTITNDSTQVIAILDTGIDWLHPDLQNKIWINPGEIPNNGIDDDGNGKIDDVRGWDWINNDNNPADDNSHGTHVAGIAAAQQNNGIGIAGVSKKARVMALKVFQSSGRGDAATITQGINYAKNKGATVFNMSFGSYVNSGTMEAALANAYATCVLVAAAGNDAKCIGPGPGCAPFFPAALSFVLGTQAPDGAFSNFDGDGPVFSNYLELWNYEMKAPGTNILSTIPNGNYRVYQGTSMATPVISGSVCMYKSLFPLESQELMWAKFIQSTPNYLNIHEAINCVPEPKLWFVSNTLVDTLSGGDGDGRVDAGETIQIWFKMRNTGGSADSVRVGIRFGEFEDTTTAQIITSQAIVGNMSAYATLTNQWIPLKIHINFNVANERDIVFKAYSWNKNSTDSIFQNIILTVENGQQLQGVLGDTLILTPDKLWIVNGSFKIAPAGVLIIKPGTTLKISSKIVNDGKIIGNGTIDSLVTITANCPKYCITATDVWSHGEGRVNINYGNLSFISNVYFDFGICIQGQYCNFNNSTISLYGDYGFMFSNGLLFENSRFINTMNRNNIIYANNNVILKNCLLDNCNDGINYAKILWYNQSTTITLTSFIRTATINVDGGSPLSFLKCNFLNNFNTISITSKSGYFFNMPNQYLGTLDSLKIARKIYDFFDDAALAQIIYKPLLTQPSDSAHGFVWKILVNNKDAQDEIHDPVGIGPQKFEVYFNRAMDPAYSPQVSFGVRYPYVQQSVSDSGRWSADYKIYTCYKTLQLYTGDGINRLRVSGAKDLDGWEIPIEDQRFEFVLQAAGSASMDFMAQAGIGKVYLEWNNAGIPDLLGFNLYRFKNITDTTYTTPVMINSTLITDTSYTDFAVNPGDHYWYYYKVVNTDLRESDSSNRVSAIPYNALIGDANGDGFVNVLDVTALIAYMLNQNPQPFLFDAADVNNDNSIDILDVIGVVNLITGKKKSISTSIGTNPLAAHIRLEDDRILLQNNGQITSMQFELAGEAIESIKFAEPPAGFELAYGIVKGKLLGIIYTCDNKTIPEGTIDLIRIKGIISPLEWGKILAGDKDGNKVPVLKDESADKPKDELFLQAYPNPFTQIVTINFRLPEDANVELKIYNIQGKLVYMLADKELKAGLHWVDWNGTNMNNRILPSGIYFCKLEGQTKSGNAFHKEIKLIYTK